MSRNTLHVVIRTPDETVIDQNVVSLRVPTQTGQAGLRPRCEPAVLSVEAGLLVLRTEGGMRYAGTAGGLLHTDGIDASLLTPLAVAGDNVQSVSQQLDQLMAAPGEEMEARRMLERLESRILQELRQKDDGGDVAKGKPK